MKGDKEKNNFIIAYIIIIILVFVLAVTIITYKPSHPYVRIVHTIENGIIVKADTIVYFE